MTLRSVAPAEAGAQFLATPNLGPGLRRDDGPLTVVLAKAGTQQMIPACAETSHRLRYAGRSEYVGRVLLILFDCMEPH